MDELEKIKKNKFEALKSQQDSFQQQMQEQTAIQQQIQQLEDIVKQRLTKDALSRLGNIKAAHAEIYVNVLLILAQAIQQGQLKEVDDNLLKEILKKLSPKKRDIKITRR